MKASPQPEPGPEGISLLGGIHLANDSAYQRKVIKKPLVEGGKAMTQFGPIKRNREKVGRNEPCPCGSGKKTKNCCPKFTT